MKLTKAQREALEILRLRPNGTCWIQGRLRVSMRILCKLGLASSEKREPSFLTYYAITDAGREALKEGAK